MMELEEGMLEKNRWRDRRIKGLEVGIVKSVAELRQAQTEAREAEKDMPLTFHHRVRFTEGGLSFI